MSLKWTGSETGILRKSEPKEKKEELFVFGYSCKLFRDDDKALLIDQGKHLIPWMGDETLKIDRYDARGALHDTSIHEAPPGGYDWRVELTKTELDVEQLCDEERYRALHTDEDEEEMYKEEELKRLHAAGYGQVGFNYDAPAENTTEAQALEVEEPFEASPVLKALLPEDMLLPETQKQHAIIEKTAKFIAFQGAQMEILIKAKQGDNVQFKFLNRESELHPYYLALIGLVKTGKWPESQAKIVEEKPEANEDYLHPSLASTIVELAPSIPSIHYKPSADCDYTMLISKMRGEAAVDDPGPPLAPGEEPPPGTAPLPPHPAQISRPPLLYRDARVEPPVATAGQTQQYADYYHKYMAHQAQTQAAGPDPAPHRPTIAPSKSTGLSLMKNYNTDSDSDDSDFDDSSSTDSKEKVIIVTPPDDVKVVIDKMAAYVARNGDEFAEIVLAKNDPRFTFLEPANVYHPFYKRLMQEKRGINVNGQNRSKDKHNNPPVSFSIKKLKEPDPILPKPALPYESSSDDEEKTDKVEEAPQSPKTNIPPLLMSNVPPVIVYKLEANQGNNLPIVKAVETKPIPVPKIVPPPEPKEIPKVEEQVPPAPAIPPIPIVILPTQEREPVKNEEVKKESTPDNKEVKNRDREKISSSSREKRKHRDRKKEYRSKSESRDSKRDRKSKSVERERRKEREMEKERKRKKHSKEEVEAEIISLEDNSDEMIDLTGDVSDTKVECETEAERAKQLQRRKRAAEFLKRVGVDPAAAALPASSLASAMVDTLESLRKKKADEEKKRHREKRKKKDKRDHGDENDRHKRRRKYDRSSDDDGSDYDGSKKKKRKKERKHSSKNKKKRRQDDDLEEDGTMPINIDLTTTLKELRTASPTKELGLQGVGEPPSLLRQDSSGDEEVSRKRRKKEREYSEGEWSSDSDEDSASSASKE